MPHEKKDNLGATYVNVEPRDHFESSRQEWDTWYTLPRWISRGMLLEENALTLNNELDKANYDLDLAIRYYHNLDLANRYYHRQDYEEAEIYLQKNMVIYETKLGVDNMDIAAIYLDLSVVNIKQKKYKEAEIYLQKSLRIYETKLVEDHLTTADAYLNLGVLNLKQKKYKEAKIYLKKSFAIYHAKLDTYHPNIIKNYKGLIIAYVFPYVIVLEYGFVISLFAFVGYKLKRRYCCPKKKGDKSRLSLLYKNANMTACA